MLNFIITEDLIKKNAIKLMETFYDYIHDDYILETHDEFKLQRKYFDENATKIYRSMIDRKRIKFYSVIFNVDSITPNKGIADKENTDVKDLILNEVLADKENDNKLKDEYWLWYIGDKIKNKIIEEEFVFDFLSKMDKKLNLDSSLEIESNEDLFCLKKAFLKAYDLFHHSGYNLKD